MAKKIITVDSLEDLDKKLAETAPEKPLEEEVVAQPKKPFLSSILKKQIVAVTGLLLIGYVVVHLAGNLLIFWGPEVFNGYAQKLAGLRPGLYIIEFGLLLIFLVHMYLTGLIVLENLNARKARYAQYDPVTRRSLAAKLMPYTGTMILCFVIWHLVDFTFVDHDGPRSVLPNGESMGLYGVVYNSFRNPLHGTLYIFAMFALGFHLMHGIQSFFQTFGLNHPKYTPIIQKISGIVGVLVAFGYSAIPIFVYVHSMKS